MILIVLIKNQITMIELITKKNQNQQKKMNETSRIEKVTHVMYEEIRLNK